MKRAKPNPLPYSLLARAGELASARQISTVMRSRYGLTVSIRRRGGTWTLRGEEEGVECSITPKDDLLDLHASVAGPGDAPQAVLLLARAAASLAFHGASIYDTAEEREYPPEAYVRKDLTQCDPRAHITVYGMEDFAPGVAWVRTRGLVKFLRPELESYCAPSVWRDAGLRLMSAAIFLIREGRYFRKGEIITIPETGERFQVAEAEPHASRTPADPPALRLRPVSAGGGSVHKFRLLAGADSASARAASRAHLEGRTADAEREYRSVLESDPCDLLVLNNLAWLFISTGRPEEALPLLERALEIDPSFALAVNNLGNVLLATGRAAEAADAYRRAARLAPRDPLPHRNLGLALSLAGDVPGAIAAHEDYLRRLPSGAGDAEAHYNLAVLYSQSGEGTTAERHLEHALSLRRSFPRALNNLGLIHHQRGELDFAAALYREALGADPAFTLARFNLAMVFAALGRLAEAITELETVVAQSPDMEQAANNLAAIYTRCGRSSEAIALLENLRATMPGSAVVHFNSALAYQASGDFGRAAGEYHKVNELEDPDSPRARRARHELEHLPR